MPKPNNQRKKWARIIGRAYRDSIKQRWIEKITKGKLKSKTTYDT